MSYLEKAQDLYAMIGQGQMAEAIDKYSADDITLIEGNGDTFQGKETQKGRLVEWQSGIEEYYGGGVSSVTANEEAGVTTVESWTDLKMKGGERMKFEEVAVQNWEGDKIVRERFYFNAVGM